MVNTNQTVEIQNLIENYLKGDALEVAFFCLQRELVLFNSNGAVTMGMTETPNIPPETLNMLIDMDDNLISNKFYAEYFAPLKASFARQTRSVKNMVFFMQRYVENSADTTAKEIFESMNVTFGESLSDIVYLDSGAEKALEFSIKLRTLFRMGDSNG